MSKIIFNLPLIVWRALMPINRYTYSPSTEAQRKENEAMRNTMRMIAYRLKKR